MSSNSVTVVTYDREDIDDMISATSIPRMIFDPTIPENFGSLDTVFMPAGRRISKWKQYFPLGISRQQIINYLFKDFQNNPTSYDVLDPYWHRSYVPYFLNDLRRIFSSDLDVIKLLQIPNIRKIMFNQN